MRDSFDAFEYLDFLRARWKFAAVAFGLAVVVAAAVGFFLPKVYTATASILIDPPLGADGRTTAVSPVYLESLKTYELLAANDTLFAKAIDVFHLRESNDPSAVESLKRRIVKVTKLKDTRLLQISATLPDPKKAQALAQYLAEETVNLSRSGSRDADQDLIDHARLQTERATVQLNQATAVWQQATAAHSAESLRSEVQAGEDLQARAQEQLLGAQADLAEYDSREKRLAGSQSPDSKEQWEIARRDLNSAHARADLLERQSRELEQNIATKRTALSRQVALEQELDAKVASARTAYETASRRLADLIAGSGTRTEQLHIIDPGIVPQAPSAPHVPMMVLASGALALFVSVLYLTVSFSLSRVRRARYDTAPLRVSAHGDD